MIPGKDGNRAGDLLSLGLHRPAAGSYRRRTPRMSDHGRAGCMSRSSSTRSHNASWPGTRRRPSTSISSCTAAHRAVGTRTARPPRRAGPAPSALGCRGSQYTSLAVREARPRRYRPLDRIHRRRDNALMETINGIYKAECVRTTIFHDGPYKTIADVEGRDRWLGRLVQPPPAAR